MKCDWFVYHGELYYSDGRKVPPEQVAALLPEMVRGLETATGLLRAALGPVMVAAIEAQVAEASARLARALELKKDPDPEKWRELCSPAPDPSEGARELYDRIQEFLGE